MSTIYSVFLIVHALIYLAIWNTPKPANPPFDVTNSWILSKFGIPQQIISKISFVLSAGIALLFLAGGVGLLLHITAVKTLLAVGAVASLFLLTFYFHPWYSFAILINLGIWYLVKIKNWSF